MMAVELEQPKSSSRLAPRRPPTPNRLVCLSSPSVDDLSIAQVSICSSTQSEIDMVVDRARRPTGSPSARLERAHVELGLSPVGRADGQAESQER